MRPAVRPLALAIAALCLLASAPTPARAILIGSFTSAGESFQFTDFEPGLSVAVGSFTTQPTLVSFDFGPGVPGVPAGPIVARLLVGAPAAINNVITAVDPATGGATIVQPIQSPVEFQIIEDATNAVLLSGSLAATSLLINGTDVVISSLIINNLQSDFVALNPNGGPGTIELTAGSAPTLTGNLVDSFLATLNSGQFQGNISAAVPEPGTWALALSGAALLALARRRRRAA